MKKIVISGSSSGIGKTIAQFMLSKNCIVLGLARHHEKFNPENPNYNPIPIDFSKINDVELQIKSLVIAHPDIDAVICSAGYGRFADVEQFSVAQMQRIMNVNFLSQAILIKNLLPHLKKKGGKIIIIGSEAAIHGHKKGSLYCASKFALRGFSQSLRQECAAASISVTLINPGMVETSFFDELSFKPGENFENSINPLQIAKTVELVLDMENNCVLDEINIQPMKKVVMKVQQNAQKGKKCALTD